MVRVKYRSRELEEFVRRRRIRFAVFFVSCAFFLLASFVWLTHISRFQIHNIEISGTHIADTEEIRNSIHKNFIEGAHVWIFPKKSVFLLSVRRIEESLKNEFPIIERINVSRRGFTTLSVEMVEYKPHALLCLYDAPSDTPCYFVASSGFVFDKAAQFSADVYFTYREKAQDKSPLGRYVIPQEDFVRFENFVKVLSNLRVDPYSAEFIDQKDMVIFVGSSTKLFFPRDIPYEALYTNFASFLGSSALASTSLAQIEYIDLRFGNKVFYKIKK